MWLTKSSIGKKVVMSVTGIALILFLTFHAAMNVVALFSGDAYNEICELLGANWYAIVATMGLAALAVIHIVFAFLLTFENRKARGQSKYAVTARPEKVEWASQNMLVLGIIIFLGLLLHLFNFWYNMMFAEIVGTMGLDSGNILQSGVCRSLRHLDCSHLVPPEPRFLERHPDAGLEWQDLVLPLENHRPGVCDPAHGRLPHRGVGLCLQVRPESVLN